MKKTQTAKLRQLTDWQVRQIDKACQDIAKERKKNGTSTNGAFLSFLYVFASALALVNAASLKAFHGAFELLNKRALAGDIEAKEVFDKLALVIEDAASAGASDELERKDDKQTA